MAPEIIFMHLHRQDSLQWLEFDLLNNCDRIKHKIFLRSGGVTKPPREGLNLGFHCGDAHESVATNRKLAGLENCVGGLHVHGIGVHEVTDLHVKEIPDCDALITQTPHIGLVTTHADCQTALFYDPINHAIANVHCGWRGNVQNIYGATVKAMQKRYSSKPENLLVGIGPSLGPNHAAFIHYKTELPEPFWEYRKGDLFNLWEIARAQLLEAGIKADHIEIAGLCTYADPGSFFSYRRDKICGRHATFIELI